MFKRVDHILDVAEVVGLNVVLNVHHYDELNDRPAEHRERFVALWDQIAERYKARPRSLYFELNNEPNLALNALWNEVLKDGLAAIRRTNPTRPVIVGSAYASCIDGLQALELPEDPNLIVTVHLYDPMDFTHQGAPWVDSVKTLSGISWGTTKEKRRLEEQLDKAASWGEANHRPIYLGEFGVYRKAPWDSRVDWTKTVTRLAEERGMSWAYWEFSSDFGVYNPWTASWRLELLKALVPNAQQRRAGLGPYLTLLPVIIAAVVSLIAWRVLPKVKTRGNSSALRGSARRMVPEKLYLFRAPRIRQLVVRFTAPTVCFFLFYRLFFTLNLETVFSASFSIAFWLAEAYLSLMLLVFLFWLARLDDCKPPRQEAAEQDSQEIPPIDVFIPTLNEDPSLLRGTILACRDMNVAHTTYVLDDGAREEIRDLAESLGVEYIARADHEDAKAGNLNHALRLTAGDFVATFDADHIPRRDFLEKMLPYFTDPNVAFVQAPHVIYNFDNFVGIVDHKRKCYWDDSQTFHRLIQMGKDASNSVAFCGSAALFRRKALEDAGLFATETITEDFHTGLRLHAKGYTSRFCPDLVVRGQAPSSYKAWLTQRIRWGVGNLSIHAYDNPLTTPGLTWAQRLSYLGSMSYWISGLFRLLLYLTPTCMLLTGVSPLAVRGLGVTFFVCLVLIYLSATVSFAVLMSGGFRSFWAAEVAGMADTFAHVICVWRKLVTRKKLGFRVTSKRASDDSAGWLLGPFVAFISVNLIAAVWATARSSEPLRGGL